MDGVNNGGINMGGVNMGMDIWTRQRFSKWTQLFFVKLLSKIMKINMNANWFSENICVNRD